MTEDDKTLVERLRDDLPQKIIEKHWVDDNDAINKQREEAADRIEALSAENERSKVETEKMLRAVYRAGYLRASGPNVKYHRNFWDFAPIRAELGFGPRAKKK